MRGTPVRCRALRRHSGIIPAHAGNTTANVGLANARRDHPRACGEHFPDGGNRYLETGSSPRMRGTLGGINPGYAPGGIIPAHAGNTTPGWRTWIPRRDHPRACGEHVSAPSAVNACVGSSPRMRGTPGSHLCLSVGVGIIPAHAGNTFVFVFLSVFFWDHPRACGEHALYVVGTVEAGGSSPRMRGTQSWYGNAASLAGIIPAHAGNTAGRQAGGRSHRDHPRACGEHVRRSRCSFSIGGSSPRMRGTPSILTNPSSAERIIPAHAGNTD